MKQFKQKLLTTGDKNKTENTKIDIQVRRPLPFALVLTDIVLGCYESLVEVKGYKGIWVSC